MYLSQLKYTFAFFLFLLPLTLCTKGCSWQLVYLYFVVRLSAAHCLSLPVSQMDSRHQAQKMVHAFRLAATPEG